MNNESKILTMLETLVEDVGGLKQDVSGLKQDVSGLKQDVSGLKQGQQRLEQDVGGLKHDVSIVKEFALNMENEELPRLNALFDAFELNNDLIQSSDQRISILEKGYDHINLDIMVLKAK
ncbi:MAG: hypothetical protein LBV20_01615 [Treponema sp.]|jgi:regulator of replication initiation timing|nr:hypothetical protein [Treponema sp.]